MNALLEAALQYGARGWNVMPLHSVRDGKCSCGRDCGKNAGKHPRIKWKQGATSDAATIEGWWRKWPDANVGLATGLRSGFGVVDIDGPEGVAVLAAELGTLPPTLYAVSGRPGGGLHAYYGLATSVPNSADRGLDFRGDGGLVVAPPSTHWSGNPYRWGDAVGLVALPGAALQYFVARAGDRAGARRSKSAMPVGAPATTRKRGLAERALKALGHDRTAPIGDIAAALAVIPNPDMGWEQWKIVGMTVWAASEGSEEGAELFEEWSAKSKKYREGVAFGEWDKITSCPPTNRGFGSLVTAARAVDPDWVAPSRRPKPVEPLQHVNGHAPELPAVFTQETAVNPLIDLNKKYSVIGDIGGKCLILSWVPSKVDNAVKVPSFQSFKSFSERYANQYITIGSGEEKEAKQLGPYWLKWPKRKSFEGIDLVPNGPVELPGNYLNLWSGFGVDSVPGAWPLMQRHIVEVLAAGNEDTARYVARFAAWAVQHPGEQAEVALVFRGGKGSGKGTFANALKRIFGQHGLQIFNSKHLVGAFNGHLRNCLLLFADEAFWAGDKQGESVLKGMLTEPALMIEQKGVDAAPWRNRLHVIMSANANWVVPASHDERRYVVVDVAPDRIGDEAYFTALRREMETGGLEAMLHDLQHMDLGGWHPRRIIITAGLQRQKELSLDPRSEWWEGILQAGALPFSVELHHDKPGHVRVPAFALLHHAHEASTKLRDMSAQALGRFLADTGAVSHKKNDGNWWILPPIETARLVWANRFGGWTWTHDCTEWRTISGGVVANKG